MLNRFALVVLFVCLSLSVSASGQEAPAVPFAEWLAGVRAEGLARGISARTLDQALAGVEHLPVVLERDRTQPELKLSLKQYLDRRVTTRMVTKGREMARRHAALLKRVSDAFGVPSAVIVAIWGQESNYGAFQGTRPVVSALATLAYDPRRPSLFREELLSALTILDRGDIALNRLTGSWAGAMGQPQFMPSSYLKFAVDFDGDTRRDIWGSPADIFASIANYLKEHGWIADLRWGRPVRVDKKTAALLADRTSRVIEDRCEAKRTISEPLPYTEWTSLGVKAAEGGPLPKTDVGGSLLLIDGQYFLVTANYLALLDYNCAHNYTLSVARLADRIAGS
jgi:membrane-bound lytic murein transglycosylase B